MKNFDYGDVIDVVSIYSHKNELMHFMLEKMRSEMNNFKKHFNINDDVMSEVYKCFEVIEQLSMDNLQYGHNELVELNEKWDLELEQNKSGNATTGNGQGS